MRRTDELVAETQTASGSQRAIEPSFAEFELDDTAAVPPAAAQDWPKEPLRIMIPSAAGGGTDVIARGLQQFLSKELGEDAYGAYCRRVPMIIPFLSPR